MIRFPRLSASCPTVQVEARSSSRSARAPTRSKLAWPTIGRDHDEAIAPRVGRTRSAVASKRCTLGIPAFSGWPGEGCGWTDEQDATPRHRQGSSYRETNRSNNNRGCLSSCGSRHPAILAPLDGEGSSIAWNGFRRGDGGPIESHSHRGDSAPVLERDSQVPGWARLVSRMTAKGPVHGVPLSRNADMSRFAPFMKRASDDMWLSVLTAPRTTSRSR